MADPDEVAWRIVRELRNEFVGRARQPNDADWAEFIAQGIMRLNTKPEVTVKTDDYDDGYEDALNDIENAVSIEKSGRLRRRKEAARGRQYRNGKGNHA